jgi:hypothetical protein
LCALAGYYIAIMCLLCRAVRVVTRIAAILLACQLVNPAEGAIRDGGIDPSNLGKGDWIYILPNAINHMGGNVPSVTDLNSMMIFLKNQGLRYIIIKAATGPTLYPSDASPQFTADVVNAGHAAGLWVFGYNRSDGLDIPGEIAVADYVFNVGADGFVFDAEIEWESQNLPNNAAKAVQLCSAVRSNWPSKFLAHSPFPIITYHSSFPYKEFGYYCDAVMPQDYWIEIGVAPTYMVSWMTSQWTSWQNALSGQWRNSIKPIVAAGQGWSSTSGTVNAAQVTEFFSALKNQANPATTGGYKGANFWRAELHPMEVWDAIRTNNITVFNSAPVITNVSAGNASSTSVTITWTTDQSSDSVVEYGLDTNYGTLVTNSTPNFYHTVNLSGLSPYTTYYYRVKSKNSNNQTGVSGVNVFATTAVSAPDVIVESRTSSGGATPYPPYRDSGFLDSTAKSTAAGLTGSGSRYATGGSGTPSCTFKPTLSVAGGAYDVHLTHPGSNASTDLIATLTRTGFTGLPGTTTAFGSPGVNTWVYVGRMTLNAGITSPELVFTYSSGTLDGTHRMYSDAVKFVYVPPPATAPAIVTHPVASQTNVQGSAATFSVVASGSPPLFYQWRRNGTNIWDAILSTYTMNNVQTADAGSYAVVITNVAGSVTSNPSVLTVGLPARITAQPVDVTVGLGSNAQFTVTASGTSPLSYQWQFNGTNIVGATTSSLTITNAQLADEGPYAVVVTNLYHDVLSSVVSLTVLAPPSITTQPQSASVAVGSSVTFGVSATGTAPLDYQWRFGAADIAGAKGSAYTLNSVQTTNGGVYSVVVSNAAGVVTSSNAVLTVLAASPPHIDSIASRPDGRIELQVSGGPGNFAIEGALVPSGWTQLSSLTATGAVFQYVDPETNQASRFYRVRLLP